MSYHRKNWDIYVAKGDGSQAIRLTRDKGVDLRPRLNRGATRVVFTSYRDGNWEVYGINADGSGLTRLTASGADEAGPVWSPDGTRIAFASRRDGNWEIYTMNADGSAQTRLTNDSADDVMPTWSPDGARIAWVRRGDLAGAIWIMDADGSDAYALTPMLPFLENLVWSPDGTRLAFDYDSNGDYFNELAVVNADGSELRTVHHAPAGVNEEVWMGSWSPNGKWLLCTEVRYYEWNGHLYLNNTAIERVSPDTGTIWMWLDAGLPILPDWQSVDVTSPHSEVESLAPYSRATGFLIRWSGADVGSAGLDSFDVQYRTGATGAWTDWVTRTVGTSATYIGGAGKTIYFRVRARDHAGNVEPWPSDEGRDVSTTVYTWRFSGQVTDNRGVPLPNVAMSITPSPLKSARTDVNGRYGARLTGTGEQTLKVSHEGYGTVGPFQLDISADRTQDYVLNPLDNVVRNGGFESSSNRFMYWAVGGTFPATLTTTLQQSGARSALLGEPCPLPCLSDPQTIGSQPPAFVHPGLVEDSMGNIHVLWMARSIDLGTVVLHAYRTPSGKWAGPHKIGDAGDTHGEEEVGLTIDNRDTLHAIWNGSAGIYYARRSPTGDWSAPVIVGQGAEARIAADGLGNVHVTYYSGSDCANGQFQLRICYLERLSSGVWEAPIPVDDIEGYFDSELAVGPDNTVHITWRGQEPNTNEPFEYVFYRARRPDGTWSAREKVPVAGAFPTAMVVDAKGTLHLSVRADDRTGYYVTRAPDGVWSKPRLLPNALTGAEDMALDHEGGLHFILSGAITPTYYWYRSFNGKWSTPVSLNELVRNTFHTLVLDHQDLMHIVWGEFTSFFYRTTRRAAQAGSVSLSQQVTIPTSLHQPTLSFMYKLRGAVPGGRSSLEVSVTPGDGESATEVFSSTVSTPWTLGWVDMASWAGQTVTVTFDVRQAAGEPYIHVMLDDISLGSWLTPVVERVTPSHSAPWTATPITLTGENFVTVPPGTLHGEGPTLRLNNTTVPDVRWVNSATLTATIPPLPPGIYGLWVTNPGGQESRSPVSLMVGKQSFLPLLFR
jgi:TolB protein